MGERGMHQTPTYILTQHGSTKQRNALKAKFPFVREVMKQGTVLELCLELKKHGADERERPA